MKEGWRWRCLVAGCGVEMSHRGHLRSHIRVVHGLVGIDLVVGTHLSRVNVLAGAGAGAGSGGDLGDELD